MLIESTNGFFSENGDRTAHAERMLASRARIYGQDLLSCFTLYSSAEPCAMCAGAIHWAEIGRLVFGQSEAALKRATGDHP